jgi:hypothetical protein
MRFLPCSGVSSAGFTLAQFKTRVKPSFDTRTEVATLDTQLKAARQSRNNADVVSSENALNVVNGVRSAPGFGENSALYKAMGYVPKNERRSGLVRPSTNPAPALKVA